MDIVAVFCQVDDFCQVFEPRFNRQLISSGQRKRIKPSVMSRSEVMTILMTFHQSGFRNLKMFYTKMVSKYWRKHFPKLLSYNRFVELQRDALILLGAFMQMRLGKCSGMRIYRFDEDRRVPQLTDQAEQGFQERRRAWKDFDRMVLRL